MSSSATAERVGARAWLEAALLAAAVGAFLALYVHRFHGPAASILPHAALVFSFAIAVAGLRLAANRLLPARGARAAGVALLTVFAGVLLVYYALVFISLQFWGRVITWRLIHTYAHQAGDFLGVLGVHPGVALVAGFLALLALVAASAAWLRRGDWTAAAARRLSGFALACMALGGVGIAVAQLASLRIEGWAVRGEPVSLTFFPERAAEAKQSNLLEGNRVSEAADRAARAAYRPAPAAPRPNVILIVGDALRGDHLQVAGYGRPTTPFLQSLDDAGRLRRASAMRSVCSESTCGLMAIAKSAYVHRMTPASFALLEVLKAHGYRTHMILGGDHVNFYDLRDAYGPVDDYFDGSMATSSYMNDDRFVLDRIAQAPAWDGRPHFFQLHLMSAHGAGLRFGAEPWQPARNYYGSTLRPAAKSGITAEDAVNYYDNGVLQFDGVVREALQRFAAAGYLRDAIVIVTGDHGEMLGEHGEFAHAQSVREGALSIPFLMIGYGRDLSDWVPRALASQVDIAPTLLHELGFPRPATWGGLPLQTPASRDFIHFQQGLRVGAYDLRGPGLLKYWRDLATGSEHMTWLRDGAEQPDDGRADPRRLDELRLQTLASGASAAPMP